MTILEAKNAIQLRHRNSTRIVHLTKKIKYCFFWKFEKLKEYDIYSCVKAPCEHYIIFDRNSDTVYHRIGEIRD